MRVCVCVRVCVMVTLTVFSFFAGHFSEVAIVVSFHLEVEDLGLLIVFILNEEVVQKFL